MELQAARRRLRGFVGTQKKVRLTRPFPGRRLHNGFIVGVSGDLVLMHQFGDFQPDGFAALRIQDLIAIRSGRYERCWEQMLDKEGLLEQCSQPSDLPLDSLASLLTSLELIGRNIIVECEDLDEENDDFHIGKVLGVTKDVLYFANFDALGRWSRTSDAIPLADITMVQADTSYVNTFSKYLHGSCPTLNRTQRKTLLSR